MKMRALAMVLGALVFIAACGDSDGGVAGTGSSWCDLMRELDSSDPFEDLDNAALPTAADLEAAFELTASLLDDVRSAAPSEISSDVNVFADAFEDAISLFGEADYDFLNIDPSDERFLALDSAEVAAANANVEAYNETECGIAADSGSGVDDGPDTTIGGADDGDDDLDIPGEGTIGERFVQQLTDNGFTQTEAECLLDGLAPTLSDGEAPAADNLFAMFEECGIDLARIADIGG